MCGIKCIRPYYCAFLPVSLLLYPAYAALAHAYVTNLTVSLSAAGCGPGHPMEIHLEGAAAYV